MQALPASVFLPLMFVQVEILGGLRRFVPEAENGNRLGRRKLVPLAAEPAVGPFQIPIL